MDWRDTYDAVVFSYAETVACSVYSLDKFIAAIEHGNISSIEAFLFELLDAFFVEVLGLAAYYEARDFVLVKLVEEIVILRVEPRRIECRFLC
jgi:hypothetical protein